MNENYAQYDSNEWFGWLTPRDFEVLGMNLALNGQSCRWTRSVRKCMERDHFAANAFHALGVTNEKLDGCTNGLSFPVCSRCMVKKNKKQSPVYDFNEFVGNSNTHIGERNMHTTKLNRSLYLHYIKKKSIALGAWG